MKKLVVTLFGVGLALTVALFSAAQGSSFKVIVHQDNPTVRLTKKDVSNYLLKKTTRWDENGFDVYVAPVDLDGKNPTREEFSKVIHGRSVSTIKNYWQRQIFGGHDAPPPEVGSDAEVIAFVRSNPGAIGYVSAGTRLDGVKEVTLVN